MTTSTFPAGEARPAWLVPAIAAGLLVLAGLLVFPQVAGSYYVNIVTLALILAYLCASWNIIGGYAGQMSLGHAAFFGVGSYAVALFSVYDIGPTLFAVAAGAVAALALSAFIAAVCFRYGLRGIYFAVGTMLVAEIVRIAAVNTEWLGRSQGFSIPRPASVWHLEFGSPIWIYYIALAMVCAVVIGTRYLQRSRLGFALITLREQEDSAQALGVDINRAKRRAFVLSAVLTALGGSLHAILIRYVAPSYDLSLSLSLLMVMGTVLGGRGTVWGPILGGILMQLIQEGLNFAASVFESTNIAVASQMIYGLILVVAILAFPYGIVGTISQTLGARRSLRAIEAQAGPAGS